MTDLAVLEPQPIERRPKRGRETLYTEAIGYDICEQVKLGVTIEAACGLHGVSRDCYYAWREEYASFGDMLLRAHAEAEAYFTRVVRHATEQSVGAVEYKAAIEWLKRQRRASWGDTLDIRKVDTDMLANLLRQQADASPQPMALEPGADVL